LSATHPLDQPIARWDLLESRFYEAWSAGTLPVSALQSYAHQYGSFISTIPQGWHAHGDHEVAEVERDHIELWRRFAATLGTDIGSATNEGVARLVTTARSLFADSVESIGALYAFEAQQPATASSKLAGLREHYEFNRAGEEYFEVHRDDEDEPRLLRDRFDALSDDEKQAALAACHTMCRELRGALDSLYDEEVACRAD
jgi:pyrroloquinoline-quinone synthase